MKMLRWAVAACVVATIAVCFCSDFAQAAAVASAAHGSGVGHVVQYIAPVLLAVGLDALRTQHSGLIDKAKAKIAEVKEGMAKDAVAAIEADHATLLADAKTVADAIAAEELKMRTEDGKKKPWAAGFYATAAETGLTLKDLNEIVAKADTHEQAKDALIDAMAKARNADKPSPTGTRATVGAEARDKFITGVTRSIVAKAAYLSGDKEGERNEYSSYTLREIARLSLDQQGVKERFSDPMMMIGRAMAPVIMAGAMSTSDFVNILANVAHKSMLKGFGEAPETYQQWTGKGTLTDFKIVSRVDLGLFPNLNRVDEGGEYSYAKLSDRGITLAIATYGLIFPITRQAIINDDLNAFSKIPGSMGRAANRTIGNLVYAILTGNVNASDGKALFHADHKNLATGGGSVLGVSALDAARAAMAKQQDPDGIAAGGLNIRPAYLLSPVTLQGTAFQLMSSQTEPGQANPNVANRVSNMAKVVAEARLDAASTTAWYLAADPSQTDTLEVSYLNGVEVPTLEQREGWNVDGVEFKVRHDAGVNLLDWRGFYKGAGA